MPDQRSFEHGSPNRTYTCIYIDLFIESSHSNIHFWAWCGCSISKTTKQLYYYWYYEKYIFRYLIKIWAFCGVKVFGQTLPKKWNAAGLILAAAVYFYFPSECHHSPDLSGTTLDQLAFFPLGNLGLWLPLRNSSPSLLCAEFLIHVLGKATWKAWFYSRVQVKRKVAVSEHKNWAAGLIEADAWEFSNVDPKSVFVFVFVLKS